MYYSLSQSQLGILSAELNNTGDGTYNNIKYFALNEDVDLPRLKRALEKVGNAHPMLKARLCTDESGSYLFEDRSDEPFHVGEQTFKDEDEFLAYVHNVPDFLSAPLYRVALCRVGGKNRIFADFHHIISDGYSIQLFFNDVSEAYSGKEPEAELISGFELNNEELEARKTPKYEEDKAYFTSLFSGAADCPTLPIPDIYGDKEKHFSSYSKCLDIDKQTFSALCEKLHTTQARVFTAAYALTLSKFTGSDETLFSTVFHGRNDGRVGKTFTMLVRTLPVYQNFAGLSSVSDLIQNTGRQLSQTRKHSLFSYSEICEQLGLNIESLFIYQGKLHNTEFRLDGKEQVFTNLVTNTPGFKFLCHLIDENGNYVLKCEYPCDLFTPEFIDEFCRAYNNAVSQMLIKERIDEIELCSEKELEKLNSFNPPFSGEYENGETVVSMFRATVEKYPDITALVFKDKRYTYRQLDEITDILSVYIAENVEKRDKQPVVSILIPRNEYMAILPLAAQKAGCCFQPLDPNYPKERLNFMVRDADAALLFADPALSDVLSNCSCRMILTSEVEDIIREGKNTPLPSPTKSDDMFILLYTSGSTGVPKGVILEQRNLVAYCMWYREYHSYAPGDALACYASFGFDVHMSEIYGALTNGYTCHIVPEEIRLDLFALNRYFEENNIIGTFLTTAIGVQFAMNTRDTSLKELTTGGEKLVSLEPPEEYQLINGYGPTETTIIVTVKKVCEKEENIPIGKPMSSVHCYVVDKYLHRLPVGAVGELIIAGPQVARGYLNRPEKTAEVFIRDPFVSETSDYLSRAYRTGDIVRWRENGDIEFIGRRDRQIKIHGYRIELKEIEAVIREFPGIKDVTVQAVDAQSGEKYIVAYVVSDGEPNTDALKRFIAAKKPAYMVPVAIMQIDRIPLTLNQKVNKRALPRPELTAEAPSHAASELPLNVLETKLKAIVSEIVGTESFGLLDRFSHLGLSSISAIRLATLVYKKFGVSVKATELISGGTLRMLEDAILSAWMEEKKPAEKRIEKQEQTEVRKEAPVFCPLSFSQQGVYAECLASPDTTPYNTPFCIAFPESISAEELKKAVREVVLAHPSFSLRFTSDEHNETVQYYVNDFEPEIDVKEMSAEEFASYRTGFVRPFSLTSEPLARFEIISADRLYLFMDIHHLITDGASIDIFMRQLCTCLDGEEIEKEDFTYFDYIADEKITPETEKFFEERMADCEEATRLIPDVFEEGRSHSEGIVSVRTDLNAVSRFAAENGVTPAAVYLAAEYIACSRYVCEDSAAITTISNGRSNMRINNTLGMFVNTLPLTVKLDNKEDTLSFIKRVAENYSTTIEHENYPFAKAAKKFDFHPSLSYTYQVGVIEEYSARGEKLSVEELPIGKAKLPCSVYIVGSAENGGLVQVNYDEALYSESMMRSFAESVENAVRGLMNEKTLAEISLTGEAQWKVLDSYNRPFDLDYDHSDTAVSLFRKQAAAHPDKTAAVYKDKEYTFRELDELSDRIAEMIYGKLSDITGLESLAEQVVPIIASRSENTFILPLAVLKAGSAYEPLDPDYPTERLNFMVKDSGAKLLLAERGLEERVGEFDGEVMFIDELYTLLVDNSCRHIEDIPASKPHDLLIMLYTSGTTGTPKGVQLEHGNLVAYAYGTSRDGFYSSDSKTAAYASFGFDVNMADTFCTLLNGGTLYVIPKDMRMNLDELAAYFDGVGITEVLLTTQVGVQFIDHYPKMKTLRTLTVGGEKLPAISPDSLSYQINNGYGPTENCCGVSLFPVRFWEPNIPIGKPMQTINAFVLDRTGHRLPAGAAGEYCLSGPQVARGYLNRPDKTSEAFEKCPFNDFRMYHTGDIVRYRENGDVEFVGRKDGQVKIRGFRVELKEIESVIREFEGIEDVTVQAYDFESGGKYLAAFIVGKNKIDTKKLSEFIKSQKPAYMVPPAISQIDEIPLTVNRKVDKKALPKPELQKSEYIAPCTKAEEDFCRIFGEILGIERVSVEDDFFELGGSSISAMKVVLAAGKAGYEIVYQDVFDNSTPRLLAALVGRETASENAEKEQTVSESAESVYGTGTTETGRDGYDYSKINALLRRNTFDAFRSGERLEVGDVLLTGATGFLGIHVLRELIVGSERKIYCLVRGKNGVSGEARLKELLTYYFETDYEELFGSRLFVVEGDATDADTLRGFEPKETLTVINCAANVAHFAKGDTIERDNLDSVNNLIDWCIAHDARLVHISTCSVIGSSKNNMPPESFRLTEQVLYAGQYIDGNRYIRSKFMGERAVYEAILERGLHAKVVRMSNLAPRFSDGVFQKNYKTNNFMATLAAYKALGAVSYDMMGVHTEFSPIDSVARAITLLATTPEDCVCFMLTNQNQPFIGDVIMQLGTEKEPVRLVEREELDAAVAAGLNDSVLSEKLRPLLAYSTKNGDVQRELGLEALDAGYTAQILFRLGFFWPNTDSAYVRRFLERLNRLGFFR